MIAGGAVMELSGLWDAGGAAIVLCGTLLATVLASGSRETLAASRAILSLFTRRFDYETARAEIAHDVEAMRRDGVVRASPVASTDREIASATDALVRGRSLRNLVAVHEEFQQQRVRSRKAALAPIRHAAEMAPVFGMAGTLFALSQMTLAEGAEGQLPGAIGMAILTTLYGLLLAHLVLHPLARVLERRMLAEEADRERLIEWLAGQLSESCPKASVHRLEKAG
ncbi:MotA/TolQ/ExbB proton channel family protein [Aurantiacibacter poecillastricola]|uniref:MotA/TolQ/ExbB proton channel family protein n=1 Tax=Aurantiacibacter poecillastricola TaxID=3064385 RepID=UPI0035A39CBE